MTNRQVKKKSLWPKSFDFLLWFGWKLCESFSQWPLAAFAIGQTWKHANTWSIHNENFNTELAEEKPKWKMPKKNINCTFVCFFGLLHVFCKNQASRIFTATEPKWKPGVLNLGQTWARLPKISPRRQKARKNLSIWHSALSFVIEEESSVANGLWVLRLDDLRG